MTYWIWLATAIAFVGNGPERNIVYFRTESCPACEIVQPAIDQLRADGWEIRSVDVLSDRKSAERWKVAELPTIIVLEVGNEVDRIVGTVDHSELKKRLVGEAIPSRPAESKRRGGAKDRANESVVIGPNFPSKRSGLGPNHPSNKVQENRDDPFAMFGENHPFYYDKKRKSEALPKKIESAKVKRPPVRNHLPPGDKIPELPETMAATVRIRIKYEESESVGTGTVIDRVNDDYIVLTCGHLFHDKGEPRGVFVEQFQDGKVIPISASVVDYRNDELDLGVVKFSATSFTKVPLLPKGQPLHEEDWVFSIGCDGGEPPSRRDTVISRLNRFLGPSNIEIAGAPVQGRSGGGLFDVRGRLIGVCVAADNENDEGLFVGPEAIYGYLRKLDMGRLFE